ncbi:hypothetical protein [Halalkalicoccus salilacus]|uniref:hypothetical protein n=1 Tax=Halalkalicoccus salilacus TaxID=3117459 RepID=UPI00300F1DB3
MSTTDDTDGSVPFGWVLLFILLTIGATFGVIYYAGGGEFSAGVVLPAVEFALLR